MSHQLPESLRDLAVPIASLRPYPNNPRQGDIGAISLSLQAHNQYRPVVVRRQDNTVLAGNHTLAAARALGWEQIAATFVDVPEDADAARIVLVDNRTSDLATNDSNALAELLQELASTPSGLSGSGYDGDALDELLADLGQMQPELRGDPDAVPEAPEDQEPATKRGDIIRLGRHTLYVGDAFAPADVDRALAGQRPTMILTDPPYGIDLDTDFSTIKGSLRAGKSTASPAPTAGNSYPRLIGDDRPFDPAPIMVAFADVPEQFWFGADYYAERIPERVNGSWLVWDKRKESQAEAIGSEFELCWSRQPHKRRMLRHDWFGFLSSANGADARHRVHPTQKPVSLLVDMMAQWGGQGDVVLDPFAGSGSTLIACEERGSTAVLMEISPRYADVICARFQSYTGITPVVEATGEASDHARVHERIQPG